MRNMYVCWFSQPIIKEIANKKHHTGSGGKIRCWGWCRNSCFLLDGPYCTAVIVVLPAVRRSLCANNTVFIVFQTYRAEGRWPWRVLPGFGNLAKQIYYCHVSVTRFIKNVKHWCQVPGTYRGGWRSIIYFLDSGRGNFIISYWNQS